MKHTELEIPAEDGYMTVGCPGCDTNGSSHSMANRFELGFLKNDGLNGNNHRELHIPMSGECGHTWTLVLQFHKGSTSLHHVITEEDRENYKLFQEKTADLT